MLAGRVEVAAVGVAGALPADQPVRAGLRPEGELAVAGELPLRHRGAGSAFEPDVGQGTFDGNGSWQHGKRVRLFEH